MRKLILAAAVAGFSLTLAACAEEAAETEATMEEGMADVEANTDAMAMEGEAMMDEGADMVEEGADAMVDDAEARAAEPVAE